MIYFACGGTEGFLPHLFIALCICIREPGNALPIPHTLCMHCVTTFTLYLNIRENAEVPFESQFVAYN